MIVMIASVNGKDKNLNDRKMCLCEKDSVSNSLAEDC